MQCAHCTWYWRHTHMCNRHSTCNQKHYFIIIHTLDTRKERERKKIDLRDNRSLSSINRINRVYSFCVDNWKADQTTKQKHLMIIIIVVGVVFKCSYGTRQCTFISKWINEWRGEVRWTGSNSKRERPKQRHMRREVMRMENATWQKWNAFFLNNNEMYVEFCVEVTKYIYKCTYNIERVCVSVFE